MRRDRPPRVLTRVAALAAATLLVASCSPHSREAILGQWQDERSAEPLEFLNDGTLIVTTLEPALFGPPRPVPVALHSAFLDDRHLKVSVQIFGVGSAQVWELASITHDRLTLKGPGPGRGTFNRVRETLGRPRRHALPPSHRDPAARGGVRSLPLA